MSEPLIYFAYGSNMLSARLVKRTGALKAIGVAVLREYQFTFNKRSKDGSLKADAFYTGNQTDEVLGVLYEMSPDQKSALDKAEGLGKGYDLKQVNVTYDARHFKAFTYVVSNPDTSKDNLPYDWYAEIIIAGAKQYEFPLTYLKKIESFKTKIDEDYVRSAKEREVLMNNEEC